MQATSGPEGRLLIGDVTVRPRKVALALDRQASPDALGQALAHNARLWGGIFNAFVPFSNNEVPVDWMRFLQWYDPDLVAFDALPPDAAVESLARRLVPMQVIEFKDLTAHHRRPTRANLSSRPAIRTAVRSLGQASRAYRYPLDCPEARILEAVYGPDPDGRAEEEVLAANGAVLEVNAPDFLLRCQTQFGSSDYTLWEHVSQDVHADFLAIPAQTPTGRLGSEWPANSPAVSLVLSATEPSVDDLCLYWALRLASLNSRCAVAWTTIRHLTGNLGAWCRWIRSSTEGYRPVVQMAGLASRPPVWLCGGGVGSEMMPDVAARIGAELTAEAFEVSTEPRELHRLLPPRSAITHFRQSFSAAAMGGVAALPPIRPTVLHGSPHADAEGWWAAELELADASSDSALLYPRNVGVSDLVFPDMLVDSGGRRARYAKVTREGHPTVSVQAVPSHTAIRVPLDYSVVEKVYGGESFLKAGDATGFGAVRVSDHGAYAMALIGLFGDHVTAGDALAQPSVHGMLVTLVKGRTNRPQSCARILRTMADGAATSQYRMLARQLVDTRVLIRGMHVKCPHCALRSWHTLGSLREDMQCSGCLRGFSLPADEPWLYRANEIVSRAVSQDQILPVLIMRLLALEAGPGSALMPELELYRKAEGGSKECDVDITAIVDGRLVLAEVTTSDGFGTRDFAKLDRLARQTNASEVCLVSCCDRLSRHSAIAAKKLGSGLAEAGVEVSVIDWPQLYHGKRRLSMAERQSTPAHRLVYARAPAAEDGDAPG